MWNLTLHWNLKFQVSFVPALTFPFYHSIVTISTDKKPVNKSSTHFQGHTQRAAGGGIAAVQEWGMDLRGQTERLRQVGATGIRPL